MQETEIEFKNLLTKDEFENIERALFKDVEAVSQTNYYVDTDRFDLRSNYLMLRIRKREDMNMLTLKVPIDEHVTEEFHNPLNEDIHIGDIVNKDMLSRPMFLIIRSHLINRTLRVVGKLTTLRKEIDYNGGTLVLDYSTYLGHEDYEIEFEVDDVSKETVFNELLDTFNITKKDTPVKVERFYNALESN